VKPVVSQCRRLSAAPIVLGGAGYSIFPQDVLNYLKADMGIQGEGEQAFNSLLNRLERKEDLSGIPGLYLPTSGLQKMPEHNQHLDHHPFPRPNTHLQLPPTMADAEIWLPIQTRRGCPMNCSYCSTPAIEGRVTRKYSARYVVEFIRQYVESGFDRFFFVDNTFNLPLSYAKTLCDQIIASELPIAWRCILYPWKIDDALAEKMARAGCKEVSLGFESGSAQILKRLKKRFQPDDIRRISEMLRKQGIHRLGFLLLGGPGETKATVEKSLYFADSLETEAMKITSGIRIYPQTDLFRTAVDEGVIERNENLIFPKFYMAHGLNDWLKTTVGDWLARRPNWRI